ncbi:MAG: hypothetical protein PHW76_06585 [Alphaproteobacteria bacterium]|nr:hypothetical protein [Alphaproteobacteria bacterium]
MPDVRRIGAAIHADINCGLLQINAAKKGLNPHGFRTTSQLSADENGPSPFSESYSGRGPHYTELELDFDTPYYYDIGIETKGPDAAKLAGMLRLSADLVACHNGLDVQYETDPDGGLKASSKVVESHEFSIQLLEEILGRDFRVAQIVTEDPVQEKRIVHSDINFGVLRVALQQKDINPNVISASSMPMEQAPWYVSGIEVDTNCPEGSGAIGYFDEAFAQMDRNWGVLSGMQTGPTSTGYGFHGPAFETHRMTQAALKEILKPILSRYPARQVGGEFHTKASFGKDM